MIKNNQIDVDDVDAGILEKTQVVFVSIPCPECTGYIDTIKNRININTVKCPSCGLEFTVPWLR